MEAARAMSRTKPRTYPTVLAEAVRQRRAKLDVSQEDVRQRSGLSVTTIAKIERGEPGEGVQGATLRRLDAALDWAIGTSEALLYTGAEMPFDAPSRAEAPSFPRTIEELAQIVALAIAEERRQAGAPYDDAKIERVTAAVLRCQEELEGLRQAIIEWRPDLRIEPADR